MILERGGRGRGQSDPDNRGGLATYRNESGCAGVDSHSTQYGNEILARPDATGLLEALLR